MGSILIPENIEDLDIKELTLKVIGSNLQRREAMISPAFKGDNVPSDPREMRLQNELLSAQSSDALTLLGIHEEAGSAGKLEAMRDMISQAIRDTNDEVRTQVIPEVDDEVLGVSEAILIEEDIEVRLDEYLKDE